MTAALRRAGRALPSAGVVAAYVALVPNAPVFYRHFHALPNGAGVVAAEALLVLSLTALLCSVFTLAGRRVWLTFASVMILVSAVCAYYMARFGVVIGYGVINAVFTTDHDMSGEVVGLWLLAWVVVFAGLPLLWLWRAPSTTPPLWRQWRQPRALVGRVATFAVLLAVFSGAQVLLRKQGQQAAPDQVEAAPNPVGVAAHSYVPSNWLAGAGMVASNHLAGKRMASRLIDPAKRYAYRPQTDLSDMVLVMVIGESARRDRWGMLGHSRATTPQLAAQPRVLAFAAQSCDTVTKLSLACMFVRPEGLQAAADMGPDIVLEDNVFSVLRKLDFRIELFAMQSELGFYNRVKADAYKFREVIAAQPENTGKPVDDMLLLPELSAALKRASAPGARTHPRAIVLHTKGSHYLYTQRYPRSFARFQPECLSTDQRCSAELLLNSYDNSILYTDHVLGETIALLRSHKALLVYTADHGESISDNVHFHGTPRRIAPPEQRAVPMVFWASERFLSDPALKAGYEQIAARQQDRSSRVGHHNLFASLLGCLGVKSPDGGITAADNLCH
ncbi:MAG: kdo(2)-lipid A phosphoethanolamine 7''-transferase [Aquabacterium sp.]|nr:kdo(2)-lipid A phosphoethanolamine 7''-transferase [Aquabacterium sp.]